MSTSRPATPADVGAICLSLPQTWFGTSWGDRPTYLVEHRVRAGKREGRGFVLFRAPHKTATDPETGALYEDLLVISCPDLESKLALVEADNPFFTIDHFRRSNAVLIQQSRLGEISVDELREVITDAWLSAAPKRLAKEFAAGLGG